MNFESGFLKRFTIFSQKLGAQVHLRSLRDAFATIMPLFILAGLAVLFNNVVILPTGFMSKIVPASVLTQWQTWGNLITNGTMNLSSIVIAGAIAYHLAVNKRFKNPIAAVINALSCSVVMLPLVAQVAAIAQPDRLVKVSGAISYAQIGTQGMFSGIVVGLLGTEIFMKLSKSKRLQFNLGNGVPPAVANSFRVMLPIIFSICLFSFVSFILQVYVHMDFVALVGILIQQPLKAVNTSLPGYLLIVACSNLLFSVGIHQAVLSGPLLDPVLLANMNENMKAFAAGQHIPNIINYSFHNIYSIMGGSGATFALLIAIFIFSKNRASRDVAKLSIAPGIFNINEPVIFGLPIVFNIPMMIPFILSPAISSVIAYLATYFGWMRPCVVMIAWTTPPFINSFLATAGDWRAPVVQLFIIVVLTLIYLPFLKVHDHLLELSAKKAAEESEKK
ncbi:PTS sugar transporter subunit IIC [Sporolactobacillus pectinivorans]|uniref:PTS sugar transporter subunit IIC n=1 Tax=Sporolactobacillus pectinivorans TaxID=1591408 RepID=UPI000C269ED3|nr:PTS transporter subunit EIIC [Sporolactobacillus pectinivorans]